jgi:hypothetical protein
VEATGLEDHLDDVGIGLVRTGVGLTGMILEAADTLLLIASNPFIGRLAANAIVVAQFGDGLGVTKIIGNKLGFLVHR